MGEAFDWASRLGVAASIADTLAFMRQELKEYGIVHGNLKSSNILMNKNMEPCISEYVLWLWIVINMTHLWPMLRGPVHLETSMGTFMDLVLFF